MFHYSAFRLIMMGRLIYEYFLSATGIGMVIGRGEGVMTAMTTTMDDVAEKRHQKLCNRNHRKANRL
jgi:hypothetical protein